MRELERDLPATALDATPSAPALVARLIVVGPGRAGASLAAAAESAGLEVALLARDDDLPGLDSDGTAVLLCVPDAAIAAVCDHLAPRLPAGIAVGHVSGATPLTALDAAVGQGCPVFSLHPLQTIPSHDTPLAGTPCALAGSDTGLAVARELADKLGMRPFEVAEANRATYHAAASMASNFLVALEEAAAELLEAAGVAEPREVLAPLVLRTAANWADAGAGALTGPIARGDEATVAEHLAALTAEAPELKPLYEALADRTRALVNRGEGSS